MRLPPHAPHAVGMSGLGQKRKLTNTLPSSALTSTADITHQGCEVRNVPQADITLAILTFCAGHPPTPARVFSLQALTNL